MPKLNQHEVTWLQTVIHFLPSAFVKIGSATTTCHCCIDDIYLRLVKDCISHRPPSPHVVFILILILNGTVASDENHRFAISTCDVIYRQLHIPHHRFQRIKGGVVACHQSFCCRTGIHHSSESAGMNLIEEEVIVSLPRAILIEFLGRDFIEVYKWYTFFCSHLHLPLGMRLTDNLTIIIVCVTRCQRHQDRITTLSPYIIDIFTHITSVCVYCLMLSRLLDNHIQGFITNTGNTCPRTTLVVWTVIVMPDRDNHPVTGTDSLLYRLP